MADFQIPQVPDVEEAFRKAHKALEGIVPKTQAEPEEGRSLSEVIRGFELTLHAAQMIAAAQLGPLVGWEALDFRPGEWHLVTAVVDLDQDVTEPGPVTVGRDAAEGPHGGWFGSALDLAGRAYKRAAGWDFSPGESGKWLVMLAPVEGWSGGDGDVWSFTGHLVGFVVLNDHDDDGTYEAVAHVWTAAAWRRRGIAQRLLAEAKARYGFSVIEEPYSDDGRALLAASGYLDA